MTEPKSNPDPAFDTTLNHIANTAFETGALTMQTLIGQFVASKGHLELSVEVLKLGLPKTEAFKL